MKHYTCINTLKGTKEKSKRYLLKEISTEKLLFLTSESVKKKIINNEIEVDNLYISSNNNLVTKSRQTK